ncbi:hypothetical protein SLNWT_5549 [Streptomyces albus]|uniref:Uncharacterized protein n=1 Tax=Streptomyces albus (strain ATCC 21838 / DSM 41398 / FERM P-419 / JCM 4703 / NBRC 107858) TaxID=1081613 RepID=A0A0B5F2W4_STRA4|nr:hypothetical protein SLNWT_5549 [Streptomyces albus]AOU80228.1 hypothetical protein SLNHY_5537 [Streptomyces albus]
MVVPSSAVVRVMVVIPSAALLATAQPPFMDSTTEAKS